MPAGRRSLPDGFLSGYGRLPILQCATSFQSRRQEDCNLCRCPFSLFRRSSYPHRVECYALRSAAALASSLSFPSLPALRTTIATFFFFSAPPLPIWLVGNKLNAYRTSFATPRGSHFATSPWHQAMNYNTFVVLSRAEEVKVHLKTLALKIVWFLFFDLVSLCASLSQKPPTPQHPFNVQG